jgi:hypothetical protein
MFDETWIVIKSDQSGIINDQTGLSGGCFGLVQIWGRRILSHPSEAPRLRMQWVMAHLAEAVQFQRDYQTIKTQTVQNAVGLGLTSQSDCDRYGVREGMAASDILVATGIQQRISLAKLAHYPPIKTSKGYEASPRWYFENEGGEITANTLYFWDIGLTIETEGRPHELHACASRHLTAMNGSGRFQFYDPNMGELSVPCADWNDFVKGWALRYTEGKVAALVDGATLLPMQHALLNPASIIPLVQSAWNAGWFRKKSAASTHAMGRLNHYAAHGPAADLKEAIRWYAGRIATDPTGALTTKYGAQPAAGAKLRTLLNTRFTGHTFF